MRIDVLKIIEELETLASELGFTNGELWRLAGLHGTTVWRLKNGAEAKIGTLGKLLTTKEKLQDLQNKKHVQS